MKADEGGGRKGNQPRVGAMVTVHKDLTTTQIFTHVMQKPGLGMHSPLDG